MLIRILWKLDRLVSSHPRTFLTANIDANSIIYDHNMFIQRILKGGKYQCTVDLLFDWFGISCMTTDNFCFYLQNRLIQTNQTGGQWYSDTSPLSIPWFMIQASGLPLIASFNFRLHHSTGPVIRTPDASQLSQGHGEVHSKWTGHSCKRVGKMTRQIYRLIRSTPNQLILLGSAFSVTSTKDVTCKLCGLYGKYITIVT